MKIALIILISIAVIGQLRIGVLCCNKDKDGETNNVQNAETNSENVVTIAKGEIKYFLDRKIGTGNAGTVYIGTYKGDEVAVKVMRDSDFNTSGLRRYKKEYAAYKQLGAIGDNKESKQYGIPPILYANEAEKVLVMPLYHFGLETVKKRQIICSVETYLQMMLELTVTIKYIHWKGVIHGNPIEEKIMFEIYLIYLIDYSSAGIFKKAKEEHGLYHVNDVDESNDMLVMFLRLCVYLKIDTFMRDKSVNLGAKVCDQTEQIIHELIATKLISSKHVRPLVTCSCVIFEAVEMKRTPDYNKFHETLHDHLYPKGKNVPRYVYDWLTDEQKAAARKVPMIPITQIPNPKNKL